MTRKPFIAGNWKMHKDLAGAKGLAGALRRELADAGDVELAVFPTDVHLAVVAAELAGSNIGVGAQDGHWESEGAFTGEVACAMLGDVGCTYVILGHSERRTLFGETDEAVNRKLMAAHAAGLVPIVCVGETLEQREAGETDNVVAAQVRDSLAGLSAEQMGRTVIAYEPVWAIGTGRTATPDQAQEVHRLIRDLLAKAHGGEVADAVRVQYGGSVKPDNAAELLGQPDIDGALVGGASLKADAFAAIARAARK